MADTKVVDASAVAALLFGEPEAEFIAGQLRDATLIAPGLLPFELTNICVSKCRRHPEQRDALIAGLRLLTNLGIDNVAVDYFGVVELALETGLTAYDASYLWLVRQLGAELVSLDEELQRAAVTR